jgi:hypothetical protein
MTVMVEKKITAKRRQREVAEEFEKWLSENPKAKRREKIQKLDQLSDTAFLRDLLGK